MFREMAREFADARGYLSGPMGFAQDYEPPTILAEFLSDVASRLVADWKALQLWRATPWGCMELSETPRNERIL